jgi:hypothetical protein
MRPLVGPESPLDFSHCILAKSWNPPSSLDAESNRPQTTLWNILSMGQRVSDCGIDHASTKAKLNDYVQYNPERSRPSHVVPDFTTSCLHGIWVGPTKGAFSPVNCG